MPQKRVVTPIVKPTALEFDGDEEGLQKEILNFYYDNCDQVSSTLPAFYYFKQRNQNVINYVMDSVRDKDSILMRGDIDEFFRKIPEKVTSVDQQIKIFSEIDRLYKKTFQTLSTNPSEVFDRDLR